MKVINVLVAESTEEYLQLINVWLRDSKIRVNIVFAKDRSSLEEIVKRTRIDFDLVYLAGRVQKESILDLVPTIRRTYPSAILIAMSMMDNHEQMQAGCDISMPKPYKAEHFLAPIMELIQKSQNTVVV